MIAVDAKEAYALFLESDFWKELSLAVRRKARHTCARCGKRGGCQAHHLVYRPHWFDVQLEDLQCLCRACHLAAHEPQAAAAPVARKPVVSSALDIAEALGISSRSELNLARSRRQITRPQFLHLRELLGGKSKRKAKRKNHKQPWRVREKLTVEQRRMRHLEGLRKSWQVPVRARTRMNWQQRGNSSN